MSNSQYGAYKLAWTGLEQSGYPRVLNTGGEDNVEKEANLEIPRKDDPKPPSLVTPSKHHAAIDFPPTATNATSTMQIQCQLE